ncbi:PhzF family phenazine biosynthesis isomerase, partial [Escherichia coli]|uniref:PhzF family phenazine biosynthesis isomerase n=1 Tax=Escherichia coli TaxID=562 RepID=UPI001CF3FA01
RREVSALTDARKTLAYDFFRILRAPQDPVTGNANGPMGAWLVHHNVLPHDGNVLRVKGHQGRALGRDGMIEVTVTIRDNQPEKVTISGTAVILFHAEWAIEL